MKDETQFSTLAIEKKIVETSHLGCLSNRQHGATLKDNSLYLKNMPTVIWNNNSLQGFGFHHYKHDSKS